MKDVYTDALPFGVLGLTYKGELWVEKAAYDRERLRLVRAEELLRAEYDTYMYPAMDGDEPAGTPSYWKCSACGGSSGRGADVYSSEHVSGCEAGHIRDFLKEAS